MGCVLLRKSHDPLITWSCKITWQTKIVIFLLPQRLWLPNLVGRWLTLRGVYLQSHMTFEPSGFARSSDNLKIFYLSYHSGYRSQTRHDDDLPWGVPSHNATGPFSHADLQNHVTEITKMIISRLIQCLWPANLTGCWLTLRGFYLSCHMFLESLNLGRLRDRLKAGHLHSHKELQPIVTPHDPSIMWFREVTRQIKYVVYLFALEKWIPNMARWQVTVKGFYLMCHIPIKMLKQHAKDLLDLQSLKIYSSKGCRKTRQSKLNYNTYDVANTATLKFEFSAKDITSGYGFLLRLVNALTIDTVVTR